MNVWEDYWYRWFFFSFLFVFFFVVKRSRNGSFKMDFRKTVFLYTNNSLNIHDQSDSIVLEFSSKIFDILISSIPVNKTRQDSCKREMSFAKTSSLSLSFSLINTRFEINSIVKHLSIVHIKVQRTKNWRSFNGGQEGVQADRNRSVALLAIDRSIRSDAFVPFDTCIPHAFLAPWNPLTWMNARKSKRTRVMRRSDVNNLLTRSLLANEGRDSSRKMKRYKSKKKSNFFMRFSWCKR